MSRFSYLNLSAMAAAAFIGLTSYASADTLSDHLKKDPSAINRSTTNNPYLKLLRDPEYTGSLRIEGAAHALTAVCSYDPFYWNSIYACNPDNNPADPIYIQKERSGHGNDNVPPAF
jgi:hypothetical protein